MAKEKPQIHGIDERALGLARLVSVKGVALGTLILIMCQGCATQTPSPAETPKIAPPSVSSARAEYRSEPILMPAWEFLSPAGPIELSFYNFDQDLTVRVTGPYRVVFWDEDRVDLIGQLDSGLGGDAALTVWHRGDQTWAYMRMAQTEYLTRIE